MGCVPTARLSRRWCKRCSLCAGGSQAAGFFLDLFSAGKQLCPEVCAYSALLALCPLQSPQVFQASPAPPGLAVTPAQSRVSWCLVQREASQTWRASELSPVVQLGQPSAVGVTVSPQMNLCNGKAQACSALCPQQAAHLVHGVPKKQCGNSHE